VGNAKRFPRGVGGCAGWVADGWVAPPPGVRELSGQEIPTYFHYRVFFTIAETVPRRNLQQQEVAAAAGITPGKLSAYENGRTRPSIETLDRLLDAMEAGLPDLHEALRVQQGRELPAPRASRPAVPPPDAPTLPADPGVNLYQVLDIDQPLPVDQEYALRQLLAGFLDLVRAKHRELHDVFDPRTNGRTSGD